MIRGVKTQSAVVGLKCLLLAVCLPKQVRIIQDDVDVRRFQRERLLDVFLCGIKVVESGLNQGAQPQILRLVRLIGCADLCHLRLSGTQFTFGRGGLAGGLIELIQAQVKRYGVKRPFRNTFR